jgi:hypothetical protein
LSFQHPKPKEHRLSQAIGSNLLNLSLGQWAKTKASARPQAAARVLFGLKLEVIG